MVRGQAVRWVWFLCVAFVGLTLAAMVFYPGSTFVNPHTRGYLWFENFFSDLGMTRTWGGAPNTTAMLLFVVALMCAGGGLILFFRGLAQRFARARLARIGSACGVLAGVCFFAIALTPQDLFSDAHDMFSVAAFAFLLCAALAYARVLWNDAGYTRRFALVFALLALLICSYIVLFLAGPPLASRAGIVVQATGQKIIVYATIVSLGIVSFGMSRFKEHLPP